MSSRHRHGVVLPALVVLAVGYYLAHDAGQSAAQSAGQPATSAQVQQWISQADTLLEANGTPASSLNDSDTGLIIAHESSGNPNAVNHYDSNAAAGHPSKGLMQTIDSTFLAHCVPNHCSDIFDPVSNIAAGVRYAIGRYGSVADVPGVIAVHDGGRYVGY